MPEIVKRVLSALIAAPVFLYLTWLGGWFFGVTVLLLTLIIQFEIIRMMEKQGMKVQKIPALITGIPVLLFAVIPEIAWIFFLIFLLITLLIETFSADSNGWKRLTATLMVAVMVPALFSGLLMLRNFGDNETGFILTLTLLLMIWANDVFAYVGGKTLGKHQLAPKISPAKTVEGFLCGFAGSLLALVLCLTFIPGFPAGWFISLPFAVLVGLLGPSGDLAESKLKRASGIKDSSGLMPGHGGLYDRFDALLFSAPGAAVYFYLLDFIGVF